MVSFRPIHVCCDGETHQVISHTLVKQVVSIIQVQKLGKLVDIVLLDVSFLLQIYEDDGKGSHDHLFLLSFQNDILKSLVKSLSVILLVEDLAANSMKEGDLVLIKAL